MNHRILAIALVLAAMTATGHADQYAHIRIHGEAGYQVTNAAQIDSIDVMPGQGPGTVIVVPAGDFTEGDGQSPGGVDQRDVTLTHDFLLGAYEVTNEEYREVLQWAHDQVPPLVMVTDEKVYDNMGSNVLLLDMSTDRSEISYDEVAGVFELQQASHLQAPEHYDPSDQPVKEVTWFGAACYCDWLSLRAGLTPAYDHTDWSCGPDPATLNPYAAEGFRLPTDAEWEYAAQFDDERFYPWGNEDPDCTRANYNMCLGWTTPVGSYEGLPMLAEHGLYDMAGNVYEWCNDWWIENLGSAPVADPVGPETGSQRVLRGGSLSDPGAQLACAYRGRHEPQHHAWDFGFRIARTMPAP